MSYVIISVDGEEYWLKDKCSQCGRKIPVLWCHFEKTGITVKTAPYGIADWYRAH
jgi:hypothetical protein